ncbi:MAG TPA: response regulator [Candidatus Nitrosotenuis sp.]|nr:response regulator [Candidatus Nitrosotenuis sp.]
MTKKPTIIVIEDEVEVSMTLEEWAEATGISVLGTGRDGKEGIDLFKKFRPQIVVLDLMMPYFDGFYAIENIRKIDPNAKFLILTACAANVIKNRIGQMKNISILHKPYDLDDVTNEIKKIVSQQVAA